MATPSFRSRSVIDIRGGLAARCSRCASAGNCAAGGFYTNVPHHQQGLVVSEANGHWGTAIEVPGLGALNTSCCLIHANVVRLTHLFAEAVELARAAVSALSEAGCARTPGAAADVIVKMVSKLRSAGRRIPRPGRSRARSGCPAFLAT